MKNNFNVDAKTLEKLIAEVDRAAQRRQENLDRAEVQAILEDLNLPPELLDEAMEQLGRREALERERKRNFRIAIAVGIVVLSVIGAVAFSHYNRQQALAKIETVRDRLTLQQDKGNNLDTISLDNSPLVYYRVTLKNVPTGQRLNLECYWIDPDGKIVQQNNYRTNEVIDQSVWNTHCKNQFGSASQTGTWEVKMRLDNGKELARETFKVVAGKSDQ